MHQGGEKQTKDIVDVVIWHCRTLKVVYKLNSESEAFQKKSTGYIV